MISNEYPTIDDFAVSWADIVVRATPDGAPLIDLKGIKSINTNTSLEVGEQRGASGGRKMKETRGSQSHEVSMVLYASGHEQLLANLAEIAVARGFVRGNEVLIAMVRFGIQIQWTPPGSQLIYEKRVKGARIIGDVENSAEGVDAAERECPLSVMQVCRVINGREIVLI